MSVSTEIPFAEELADDAVDPIYARCHEQQATALSQLLHGLSWRQLVRRRSFCVNDLIPAHHLKRTDKGWRSTGVEPEFLLPCLLPAGWVKIAIRVRRTDRESPEREVAELHFDHGDGFQPGKSNERLVWSETLADELYLNLPRPALALKFSPLAAPGSFVIEDFRVEPIPRLKALTQALLRKIRLLRAYRCTGPVLWRATKLMLKGRFVTFARKIFQGLPDSRLLHPDHDNNPEVFAAWRSQRTLTDLERERLVAEVARLSAPPTLAVLAPIDQLGEKALLQVIDAMRRQVYPHWQLIAVLADTTPEPTCNMLARFTATEERIRTINEARRGNMTAAVREALRGIDVPYVAVLNPGYAPNEAALLRLAQQLVEAPDTNAIANQPPPPKEDDAARGLENADLFWSGAGGPQLHLFRTNELLTSGAFPEVDRKGTPPGARLIRRFIGNSNVRHLPGLLTFPTASIQKEDEPRPALSLGEAPLLITGNIIGISGYDYVVFELVRGLHSLGVDLRLNAASGHRADLLPPALLQRIRPRQQDDRELLICPPHYIAKHKPEPGYILFTMWESNRLPADAVEQINRASLVIVPSRFGVETFRNSGVTAPLAIVPLGYDPLTFYPNGSWPGICTFGTAAALWGGGVRKNTRRVIELFQQAFPDEDDVRLRVKVTPLCELPEPEDPRIEVLRGYLAPPDLAEWYRSLTAYVNGSFAEGFGLHLVEAMACGRPVISTCFSAVADYFDEAVGYVVDHRLVPTESDLYPGEWGQPDDESLMQAMRAAYERDAQARRRGQRAAARARQWTWKNAGQALLQVLRGGVS